ncbi:MAG: dockerin type I repeat-containing protein [Oscillospiraceae bacterium]|nr:dockerin type I repeat-containing protein [Oscillospiraceae bacterium]
MRHFQKRLAAAVCAVLTAAMMGALPAEAYWLRQSGDVDLDETFGVKDVIAFQKYLLGVGRIDGGDNADFDGNGVLDVMDLAYMKRALLHKGSLTPRPGIWYAYNGNSSLFYWFGEDGTGRTIWQFSGEEDSFTFDYDGRDMTLHHALWDDHATVAVYSLSEMALFYPDGTRESLYWYGDMTMEELAFYTDEVLIGLSKDYYQNATGIYPRLAEVTHVTRDTVKIYLYDYEDDHEIPRATYTVNWATATGIDDAGNVIDLSGAPSVGGVMHNGVYAATGDLPDHYYYFAEDGSGVDAEQSYSAVAYLTWAVDGRVLTISYPDGGSEICDIVSVAGDDLTIRHRSTSQTETLDYLGDFRFEDFVYFPNDVLGQLSLDYYEMQTGYRPGAYEATIGEDGLIAIRLYDDMGDRESTVTWYYIDRYTAMGEDLIGNPVDLHSNAAG